MPDPSAQAFVAQLSQRMADEQNGYMSRLEFNLTLNTVTDALKAGREAQFKLDCAALCPYCAHVNEINVLGYSYSTVDQCGPAIKVRHNDWRHELAAPKQVACQAGRLHEFHSLLS